MDRRLGWVDVALPLTALFPALLIARLWPNPATADLPLLVVPLYALYRLFETLEVPSVEALLAALLGSGGLWVGAAMAAPSGDDKVLWVAAAVLCGGWWAAARHRGPGRGRAALVTMSAGTLAALAGSLVLSPAPAPRRGEAPARRASAEVQQPLMFIPLEVAPGGRRLALFSLRDRDDPGDGTFALWSLDLGNGNTALTYRGYPYLLADWSPDGGRLAFMASERSWEEEVVPFGVVTAGFDGSGRKIVLPPPSDQTSWFLPTWSRVGNLVGAWRLAASESGGQAMDVPRSFVVPAGGGTPKEITIRGCRLALLSAWDHKQALAYCMTEKGVFSVGMDGTAKRLVPSGDGPLDPLLFITSAGPAPDGAHLAYLEVMFRRGEIDKVNLGLCDPNGRHRMVLRDMYPIAYGWDASGQTLAAAKVDGRRRVHLLLTEMASRQRWVDTGLTLASTEYPVRVQAAPGGRYWALDGQFTDEESWDVAVFDQQSNKTVAIPAAHNNLAAGWRADGKLVLSTLSQVAVVNPDGSGYTPIYGNRSAATALPLPLGRLFDRQRERQRVRWLAGVMGLSQASAGPPPVWPAPPVLAPR